MLKTYFENISTDNKLILKKVNLEITEGTINILEGSNGSGKSTLAKAILGFPSIKTKGDIVLNDINISSLPMDQRVQEGLYLAHQSPLGITGVKLMSFLRSIYLQSKYIEKKVDLLTFKKQIKEYLITLNLPIEIIERDLNVGFSGGEMKKIEFLQLMLLKPKYAILDEIDSGLDNASRKNIFEILSNLVKEGMGVLLITHRENISKELKINKTYRLNKGELKYE